MIIPWKYKKSVFFLHIQTRAPYCGPPIVDMFSKKIATYDKINFPQQANSMVGGTRRNCAYDKLFWQIKPKIILILIQLGQKWQNLMFLKKWTCDKIDLTSRLATIKTFNFFWQHQENNNVIDVCFQKRCGYFKIPLLPPVYYGCRLKMLRCLEMEFPAENVSMMNVIRNIIGRIISRGNILTFFSTKLYFYIWTMFFLVSR